MPSTPVTRVAGEITARGPVAGAENVTVTPPTGLAFESRTRTCKLAPKAILAVTLCVTPATALTDAGPPEVFVNAKVAGVAAPAEAVTMKLPATELATADVEAMPDELVIAEGDTRNAEAPAPGALNVTVTPATGSPVASSTVARSGVAYDA